ncbi:MAG: hypothetical protein Q9P14_08330 [candidate division KSB1 bacterium]|nr:hypothetical protein [candidate division KSB1 bacterium]
MLMGCVAGGVWKLDAIIRPKNTPNIRAKPSATRTGLLIYIRYPPWCYMALCSKKALALPADVLIDQYFPGLFKPLAAFCTKFNHQRYFPDNNA